MHGVAKHPCGLSINSPVQIEKAYLYGVRFIGEVVAKEGTVICSDCVIGFPARRNLRQGNPRRVFIGRESLLRSFTIVYEGVIIGDDFESGGSVQIRENSRIGKKVSIGSRTILERDTRIGDFVRVHSSCFLSEEVTIDEGAWIGPSVSFLNDKYPVSHRIQAPRIGKGVIIGGGCTIMPGVTIGDNSVVAATSLVVKNVSPDVVVRGSPAKVVMSRRDYDEKKQAWDSHNK